MPSKAQVDDDDIVVILGDEGGNHPGASANGQSVQESEGPVPSLSPDRLFPLWVTVETKQLPRIARLM